MSETVLSRVSLSIHRGGPSLTESQKRAENLLSSFVDHATDGYTLAGMVGGGLVYRLGRVGTLAFGSRLVGAYGRTPLHLLIRPVSIGLGFAGEVFTFEAGQRALRVGIGGADPNLLRWSGENGLGRGLVGAAITLGSLKGTGAFVNGRNPILQHLFQDSAMVLAHNVHDRIFSSRGTLQRAPTLAEQFVEAEATLWQMNAGMALVHGAFPGLGQMERSLDLGIRSRVGALSASGTPLQLNHLPLAFDPPLPDHIFAMTTRSRDGGGRSRKAPPPFSGESLPLPPERTADLVKRAQHLEALCQRWMSRIDENPHGEFLAKMGGPFSMEEFLAEIPGVLAEHRKLLLDWGEALEEEGNHPDRPLLKKYFGEMSFRVEGMQAFLHESPSPPSEARKLKPFLGFLYRAPNVLVGLTQSNNYDPYMVVSALKDYDRAMRSWYELFQRKPKDPALETLFPPKRREEEKRELEGQIGGLKGKIFAESYEKKILYEDLLSIYENFLRQFALRHHLQSMGVSIQAVHDFHRHLHSMAFAFEPGSRRPWNALQTYLLEGIALLEKIIHSQ